jgi:hypothetical protein
MAWMSFGAMHAPVTMAMTHAEFSVASFIASTFSCFILMSSQTDLPRSVRLL